MEYWIDSGTNIEQTTYIHHLFHKYTTKILEKLDMDDLVKYYCSAYDVTELEEKQIQDRLKAVITYPNSQIYNTNDYIQVRGIKYSPKRMTTELLKARGNLTRCAINLGMRRKKLADYFNKNDAMRMMYHEAQNLMVDYVEDKLLDMISSSDLAATKYWLNCKGTSAGYGSYEARRAVAKVIADTKGVTERGEGFSITDWDGNKTEPKPALNPKASAKRKARKKPRKK